MMRSRTPSASAGIAGIRLVSITVDPEHDDPKHLRAYAMEICADPARWTLLAGDLEAIRRLAFDGFHVPVGEPQALPGGCSTSRTRENSCWWMGRVRSRGTTTQTSGARRGLQIVRSRSCARQVLDSRP